MNSFLSNPPRGGPWRVNCGQAGQKLWWWRMRHGHDFLRPFWRKRWLRAGHFFEGLGDGAGDCEFSCPSHTTRPENTFAAGIAGPWFDFREDIDAGIGIASGVVLFLIGVKLGVVDGAKFAKNSFLVDVKNQSPYAVKLTNQRYKRLPLTFCQFGDQERLNSYPVRVFWCYC